MALATVAFGLFMGGLHDTAEALHARVERVAARLSPDPTVAARVFRLRGAREQVAGNLGSSRAALEAAVHCFERAGDLRAACLVRGNLGYLEGLLGAYTEAVPLLRAVVVDAAHMGLDTVVATARHNLGWALGEEGALEEARAVEEQAAAAFMAFGDRRLEGAARAYLGRILLRAGELDAAEAEARRALDLLEALAAQMEALALLADVLRARGQPAEALATAREAMAALASLGKVDEGEELCRLAHAEALEANGDRAAARAAIAEARDRLLAKAARIGDAGRRATFLERVPENARTLSLARAWLER
jgi:tetratricopeptide (TPR) repeat protein